MSDFLTDAMSALSGSEFDEIPVSVEEFVTSEEFLNLPRLSDYQYQIVRAASQIYREDTLIAIYGEEAGRKRFEETYTEVVLQLGKGSMTLDTELYDASSGRWIPMSESSQGDTRVASMSPNGKVVSKYATEVFKSCDAKTYEVTTSKGFKVKVNMGHKFVTAGFALTPLCDLSIGDRIGIPAGLPVDDPIALDEREVKLLGYWLGDGMMPLDQPRRRVINMDFSENDVEAMKEYIDILHSYGDSPNIVKHPDKKMWFVRGGIRSCPATLEIARKHGLWNKRAWNKEIPDAVWSLPDHQLSIFISRLWGTDGCVYMKKSKYKDTPVLEYCSTSRALAEGLQKLLMRAGIIAGIRNRIPSYTYDGVKKQGRMAYYLTISDIDGFGRFHEFITMMDKSTTSGVTYNKTRSSSYPSRYEEGVYWDAIVAIKEVGTEELFTVTAPEHGNFAAGMVLNGNSGK